MVLEVAVKRMRLVSWILGHWVRLSGIWGVFWLMFFNVEWVSPAGEDSIQGFLNEIKALKAVWHTHIVRMLAYVLVGTEEPDR